jgi:hypothetical protein
MKVIYLTIMISIFSTSAIFQFVYGQSENSINMNLDGTAFLPIITEERENPD